MHDGGEPFMDVRVLKREQRSLGRIFCLLAAFMSACGAACGIAWLAMPGRFGMGMIAFLAAAAAGSMAASLAARLAWRLGEPDDPGFDRVPEGGTPAGRMLRRWNDNSGGPHDPSGKYEDQILDDRDGRIRRAAARSERLDMAMDRLADMLPKAFPRGDLAPYERFLSGPGPRPEYLRRQAALHDARFRTLGVHAAGIAGWLSFASAACAIAWLAGIRRGSAIGAAAGLSVAAFMAYAVAIPASRRGDPDA